MSNHFKVFLISFLVSMPFWWGVNVFSVKIENFWFWNLMAKNPEILRAYASSSIDEIKLKKERENKEVIEIIKNSLSKNTMSALSLEIDEFGRKEIIFEKDYKNPLAIASLSKLMTALVVFELNETYDLKKVIEISKEAVSQDGRSFFGELKEGERFSIETLLNIMLIESSNDAAYAISEYIGKDAFVDLMNLYAKQIGLKNTYFINPTGLELDDINLEKRTNFSTAEDIAKLAVYILKNHKAIFGITAKKEYKVFTADGVFHHNISQNTNILLGEINGIVGGKTGWTPLAKGCLLLVLENPKKNGYFINVILGADDRFEEMRKLLKMLGFVKLGF